MLSWLATSTRPDLAFIVVYLQSAFSRLQNRHVKMFNGAVARARAVGSVIRFVFFFFLSGFKNSMLLLVQESFIVKDLG